MGHLTEASIELQGGLLRYYQPVGGAAGKSGRRGGKRGCIKGLSSASRRRLMQRFARVDWCGLVQDDVSMLLVTLTTPPEYWNQEKAVYRALRRFRDWLSSVPGYRFAFVRKERGGKNGMLHYHLVVFGLRFVPARELARRWTGCLRWGGNEKTKLVRVDVQEVVHAERVVRYFCKYMCKAAFDGSPNGALVPAGAPSNGGGGVSSDGSCALALSNAHNVDSSGEGYTGGRCWYVWGHVPEAEKMVVDADAVEDLRGLAVRVRRIFRKWRKVKLREQISVKICRDVGLVGGRRVPAGLEGVLHQELAAALRGGALRWLGGGAGFTLLASPPLDADTPGFLERCVICVLDNWDGRKGGE